MIATNTEHRAPTRLDPAGAEGRHAKSRASTRRRDSIGWAMAFGSRATSRRFPTRFGISARSCSSTTTRRTTTRPTNQRRGVGVHPHRGFETVTHRLAGERRASRQHGCGRRHRTGRRAMDDSRVGHPAQGVPRRELRKRGGPLQMAQLWVNLPKAHKMAPPRYQPLVADQMGIVNLAEGSGCRPRYRWRVPRGQGTGQDFFADQCV